MSTPDITTPRLQSGYWTWAFQGSSSQIMFLGKGPRLDRNEALREVSRRADVSLSWPRQVHSGRVLRVAQHGFCGDGDAVVTADASIALSIVTADCVPIVLEGCRELATIHAGWRGLSAGIIEQTLAEIGEAPQDLRAWIGPAIGACCYEVESDVAHRVAAASSESTVQRRQPRPHLDLVAAASWQLIDGGVEQTRIRTVPVCTRCSPDWLWSYRREGARAGRNLTLTWRMER